MDLRPSQPFLRAICLLQLSLLFISWEGTLTTSCTAWAKPAQVQEHRRSERSYTLQEKGVMVEEDKPEGRDCRQPGSDEIYDCDVMKISEQGEIMKFKEKIKFWNEVEKPVEIPVNGSWKSDTPDEPGIQSSPTDEAEQVKTEKRIIVHYWLDPSYLWTSALEDIVRQATESIEEVACVKFQQIPGKDIPTMKHFLKFVQKGGCYSHVGIQRRPQEVSLGKGCHTVNIATHEILHALGMHHEQNRADRDKYLYVYNENIGPRFKFNFQRQPGYKIGKYDTYSVMHYRQADFAVDPKVPVLFPRQVGINPRGWHTGGCPFGSHGCHKYLSLGDIAKLREIYGTCGGETRADDFRRGYGRGLARIFGGTASLLRFFG